MQTLVPLHRSWRFWVRSWFCSELFWVRESFMRGNWDRFYRGDFEKNSRTVLEEHCQAVRSQVGPERLLEWEIDDGWGPLCRFLGKAEPDRPFPTLNAGRNYEKLFRERIARADGNMLRLLAGFAVVAIASAYYTKYSVL